jgi:hypothetical protein
LMILALEFIIPLIVTYWVPKYLPGLAAFTFFLPGYFFLSIILAAGNIMQVILVVRKRLRLMVYIQLGAVIVEVLFGFLFLNLGWGIAGVALSSTLAYAFYGVIVLILSTHFVMGTLAQKARFLGEIFGLAGLGVLLFFAFTWLSKVIAGDQLLFQTAIQLLGCALTCIPLLYWLDKRVKIMSDFRPFLTDLKKKMFPGASS